MYVIVNRIKPNEYLLHVHQDTLISLAVQVQGCRALMRLWDRYEAAGYRVSWVGQP